ncbi:MAG: hypothetical protein GY760_21940, partial [Deltaproteobacteria bacterium]|nr:hypothetical protein [Deltaproteobacteria bacterium]
ADEKDSGSDESESKAHVDVDRKGSHSSRRGASIDSEEEDRAKKPLSNTDYEYLGSLISADNTMVGVVRDYHPKSGTAYFHPSSKYGNIGSYKVVPSAFIGKTVGQGCVGCGVSANMKLVKLNKKGSYAAVAEMDFEARSGSSKQRGEWMVKGAWSNDGTDWRIGTICYHCKRDNEVVVQHNKVCLMEEG